MDVHVRHSALGQPTDSEIEEEVKLAWLAGRAKK